MCLCVPPKLAVRNGDDFTAMAKPDSMTYGSLGVGSVGQLAAEIFARSADIKMTHIPYNGIGDGQIDVGAEDIQLFLDGPLSSAELERGGTVKPLAVTGNKRIAAFQCSCQPMRRCALCCSRTSRMRACRTHQLAIPRSLAYSPRSAIGP